MRCRQRLGRSRATVWVRRRLTAWTYPVETEVAALDEVAALPAHALPAYAEPMTLLAVAPWSGDPYHLQRPDANMRTHTFGEGARGLAISHVLDHPHRQQAGQHTVAHGRR